MDGTLETFLSTGVLAFMLIFARVGTALMIMPGLGDSFISERIRLHMALAISFVLFPLVMKYVPVPMPPLFALVSMMVVEVIVGLLIGTVARIFMTALDTAGMVVSTQSGLANAQVFNPSLATQGSLMGAFLSVTGVLLLLASNLHHLLLMSIVESYKQFPMGDLPDTGSMADLMARVISASFSIGVQMAAPFIVLTMLIYVGMGVLSRLMPQVQVFLLALPIQILLSILMLFFSLSAMFAYWFAQFESGMLFFLSNGAGGG